MISPVRRALISVHDKQGVVELGRKLEAAGVELLSSGGTARLLREAGLRVVAVSDYTGSPEMLDGRVKTLHPRIHGGILAVRSNAEHMADLERHGIGPIDLVVVNLYPFERTISRAGVGLQEAVEMIDVGGPTMVRAAAKNFAHVGVVVDPVDYGTVLGEIETSGGLSDATRLALAVRAFRATAEYDHAIAGYLAGVAAGSSPVASEPGFPQRLAVELTKAQDLRYGENPHQRAAFYRDPAARAPNLARARQLQGKELSFNNILDFDAALGLAADLPGAGCTIIKHGNPCGTALAAEARAAFEQALSCDPVSAFGGVIAFNRRVDLRAAESLAEHFFEGVIAPAYDEDALPVLSRKKNLRLLEIGDLARFERDGLDFRRVSGGLLVQTWDRADERVREAEVVTRRAPTDAEWRALEFAWIVARHVKSNAIVYATAERTLGIGAGQMSRVDSARIATEKALAPLAGSVMASDAFFPFRDGIDVAAGAGIAAVVQPGGSVRDREVIDAADEHGMAMVLTGRRHFRH